jgi:hypothetical protein
LNNDYIYIYTTDEIIYDLAANVNKVAMVYEEEIQKAWNNAESQRSHPIILKKYLLQA